VATKAVQVSFLLAGLTDTNGDPLSGGKVYTYEAGLSTPKDTYLDRDKTSVAPNPIVLDSYGRAQVYADGLYKFVVKDASDATLYTWDYLSFNVSVPYISDFTNAQHDHSSAAMGGDLGILNEVKTKGPWVDVRAYGAVGDGVTDDSDAFSNALATGKNVYIPSGDYYIGTDGKLIVPTYGQAIRGDGIGLSKIKLGTGVTGFNINAPYSSVTISDLQIYGTGSGRGIYSNPTYNIWQSRFVNLRIETGGSAIYLRNDFSNTFVNVNFGSETEHGIDIEGGPGTTLIGCYARAIDGSGMCGYRIRGKATLIGCNGLNSGDVWGIFGDSATGALAKVLLIGCNIEDFNVDGIRIEGGGHEVSLYHCSISTKANTTYNYVVNADSESYYTYRFVSNTFYQKTGSSSSKVALFKYYFPVVESQSKTSTDFTTATDSTETNTIVLPRFVIESLGSNRRGLYFDSAEIGWINSFSLGGKKHTWGSAAPTSGSWATGDIVYNISPIAGGYIGWVCVNGGTPGTWKEFGSIVA